MEVTDCCEEATMVWIAGLFLVAHGLIHLAIWLPKADPKAPFDAGHSPFAGNVRHTAAAMAVAAAVVLAAGGLGLIGGASWWQPATITGAALSTALLLLTFNKWWLIALGINAAIIVLSVQQNP
jgi:hypothetical protein